MSKITFGVLWFFMILVVISSCGMGCVIYNKTLIEWWIPIAVALALALVTTPFYRRWSWLMSSDKIANLLCHWICIGSIGYIAFLGGNYWFSHSDYQEKALIEGKYQKKIKKVRLQGRRYITEGFRMEYYLLLVFNNGETKMLEVPLALYKRSKKGNTRTIGLREGYFGFPVVVDK